jgi:hypothetical protein
VYSLIDILVIYVATYKSEITFKNVRIRVGYFDKSSVESLHLYLCKHIYIQLYSINSGAAVCATGTSITYRSLLKYDRMSIYILHKNK